MSTAEVTRVVVSELVGLTYPVAATGLRRAKKKFPVDGPTTGVGVNRTFVEVIKIVDGVNKTCVALNKLFDGGNKLCVDGNKLFDGANKLFVELNKSFDGANKLFDGANKLLDGVNKLFDGANKSFDGVNKLFVELNKLFDGVNKTFDAVNKFFVELNKFLLTRRQLGFVKQLILEQNGSKSDFWQRRRARLFPAGGSGVSGVGSGEWGKGGYCNYPPSLRMQNEPCHPETAGAARANRDVCAVGTRRRRTSKDLKIRRSCSFSASDRH